MGCAMAWSGIRKSGKRSAVSRESLESAVTEAVKPLLDGEPFVGVIIQHIEPKSRTDSNWAIRGVRFGKADRKKIAQGARTCCRTVAARLYPGGGSKRQPV